LPAGRVASLDEIATAARPTRDAATSPLPPRMLKRIGHRPIGSLALARSLDREHDGALPEALAALTDAFDGNTEEVEEIEDLLADAVRLAAETGDLRTAQALADHAAALATDSGIPHRQANALYCSGLLDHDPSRLLAAAERYDDASRPLRARRRWRRRPRSSSAPATATRYGTRSPAPWRPTPPWAQPPTSPASRPPAHGIRRRPPPKARRVIDINAQLIAGAGHGRVTVSPLETDSQSLIRESFAAGMPDVSAEQNMTARMA
jgi:hypothetical protein